MSISRTAGFFVVLTLLAGCAASTEPVDLTDVATGELNQVPAFVGTAPGSSTKIFHRAATRFAPSDALATIVHGMDDGDQNTSFIAGAFRMSPGDLTDFRSSSNAFFVQKNMAYDMMFRADGSTAGGKEGLGFQEKWTPEVETMRCRVAEPSKGLTTFKSYQAYTVSHEANKLAFEKATGAAVGSLLKDIGSAALYSCHWDNTDDTDADALVVVNFQTGDVRVLLAFAGA
jgi:hypothetical protein